jgi:trehalose/maltose transport system permease protein
MTLAFHRRARPGGRRARTMTVIGFVIGVLFLSPVLWMLITAFSPERSIGRFPPALLPEQPTIENFVSAFTTFDFGRYLLNSVIVCVVTTVLVVTIGSLAAYGLARTRMRARLPILVALLVISTFPVITVVAPLYAVMRTLGTLNSYEALVIPYTALNLPFAIWLMHNFLKTIPAEIEEAGQVDGAGPFRIAVQLIGPQALPGIFVTSTLTFVACWQEFLMALSFNSSEDYRTAPVGIALVTTYGETPFATIFAASTVALLPIVILVFIMRKWIIGGGLSGAVKG